MNGSLSGRLRKSPVELDGKNACRYGIVDEQEGEHRQPQDLDVVPVAHAEVGRCS